MDDAINRAKAYVDAGADGIMIHSREKEPDEIFEFCEKFREFAPDLPLVVVPTSFNTVYEDEFARRGVNIVIYANHLIRSAYPAMMKTAETILENNRCHEVDETCLSIKEILTLIPDE
jgi:phosphoenolpyruvate phosphomutase